MILGLPTRYCLEKLGERRGLCSYLKPHKTKLKSQVDAMIRDSIILPFPVSAFFFPKQGKGRMPIRESKEACPYVML